MHSWSRGWEAAESPEARFAKCQDRLQPLLLNTLTGGGAWTENCVSERQVCERYGRSWPAPRRCCGIMRAGWSRSISAERCHRVKGHPDDQAKRVGQVGVARCRRFSQNMRPNAVLRNGFSTWYIGNAEAHDQDRWQFTFRILRGSTSSPTMRYLLLSLT